MKTFGALKMMYWRHKHYQKRGKINRINKILGKIIRKRGHDEWKNVVSSMFPNIEKNNIFL